ncbi:MAG: hypothetical protein LBR81_09535 [Prevotellaceae bacterium]|jgi:hypothetical protein|nr:hypothetical protein [Prevotellaceae bacterium]
MLKYKRSLCATLFLLFVSGIILAQNNTNSYYSRYGYGELSDFSSGRSRSMGGVSTGMRSGNEINTANPASYTAIDSLTFLFEFGVSAKQYIFESAGAKSKTFTGNIEYLAMQFPLSRRLAVSAGLLPFSNVGYSFTTQGSASMPTYAGNNDQVDYMTGYTGSGNITQAYLGLSGKIGEHFAVGINASYLFGTITNSRALAFMPNRATNDSLKSYASTLQDTRLRVQDLRLRYGVQYFTDLGETDRFTAGLIFENKTKLDGDYTIETQGEDTISTNAGDNFELPLLIGVGASYQWKNRLTVAADFMYQDWANVNYFGRKDTLRSRSKFSLGAEFIPNRNAKNYFSRVAYRIGGNYSSGYVNVNNRTEGSFGLTCGLGLPMRRSTLNVGFEYGRRGSTAVGQIREDYFRFNLSAAFNEMWFFKRRFD